MPPLGRIGRRQRARLGPTQKGQVPAIGHTPRWELMSIQLATDVVEDIQQEIGIVKIPDMSGIEAILMGLRFIP